MSGKPREGVSKLQEELAHWMLMDKRTRQVHGMPLTQKEWAQTKGITDRTVSRWINHDERFQKYAEQLRVQSAQRILPNSTVAAGNARAATDPRLVKRYSPPDPAGPDDDPYAGVEDPKYRAYLEAKDALLEGVRAGEKGAIETWFKLFGQEFIQAERAGSERLVDLDDDELADELVGLLGPDRVAQALASSAAS